MKKTKTTFWVKFNESLNLTHVYSYQLCKVERIWVKVEIIDTWLKLFVFYFYKSQYFRVCGLINYFLSLTRIRHHRFRITHRTFWNMWFYIGFREKGKEAGKEWIQISKWCIKFWVEKSWEFEVCMFEVY